MQEWQCQCGSRQCRPRRWGRVCRRCPQHFQASWCWVLLTQQPAPSGGAMGGITSWAREKLWRAPSGQFCALWRAGLFSGPCAAAGVMRTSTGVHCLPWSLLACHNYPAGCKHHSVPVKNVWCHGLCSSCKSLGDGAKTAETLCLS